MCYQSRVGPLEWIGPATDAEIRRAGADGVPLVVAPIAFVSEHSETLVELDLDYRRIAEESGVPAYHRVPTVGAEPGFIAALAGSGSRCGSRSHSIGCPPAPVAARLPEYGLERLACRRLSVDQVGSHHRVIAWMAGLLYLPRLFVYHAMAPAGLRQVGDLQGHGAPPAARDHDPGDAGDVGLRRCCWRRPRGWSTGIEGGSGQSSLWSLALLGYHAALARWRRAFAADRNRHSPRFFRMVNELPTLAADRDRRPRRGQAVLRWRRFFHDLPGILILRLTRLSPLAKGNGLTGRLAFSCQSPPSLA